MPVIINEDNALKTLLSGLTVSDAGNAARPVGVWFGQPDAQIRQQSYPYITIDLIGISEAQERVHAGLVELNYVPEGVDPDKDYLVQYPIPVDLMYQVTTYARQPRHDRELLAQLLYSKIPLRFAVLTVGDNTVQGTTRRLDVLDISKRDITEQGKRLFVNAITVRVSSEIAAETYKQMYKVLQLNVTGTTGSQAIGRSEFTAIDTYTQSAP